MKRNKSQSELERIRRWAEFTYKLDVAVRERTAVTYDQLTGHYTGRCSKCGSNNLWDDNLAYGCNSCGAVLLSSNS